MLPGIATACSAMEECYELMLGYAAQGLPTDQGSQSGARIRDCLARAGGALIGLINACAAASDLEELHPFLAVLDRDARSSLAAVEFVLAQPSISSQLIDNLNASIHLRALLTDLFLLDQTEKASSARPLPVVSIQEDPAYAQEPADR
jgi:hypothetical protein